MTLDGCKRIEVGMAFFVLCHPVRDIILCHLVWTLDIERRTLLTRLQQLVEDIMRGDLASELIEGLA